MASFGTAFIDVAGDFGPLEAQIRGMSTNSSIGKKMEGLGKSLTRSLTLPIVGVGVAAGKMSMDFQRSMTLISTQAGGTKKEVKGLSAEILKLSQKGRFAQGPNELAQGLFNIESAGYRGSKAMKVLKSASDLATVGNADLESTTSALVGAMKTGIKGTGNMKEAIGLLNATVGAGKLHMEDLNAAIGTGFLGSAKGLGVSLQSVNAALAELTSQGIPANSAATRLRMTMSLMANPTEKAAGVLKGIGIGSETLAKQMREPDGLNHALETLHEHLKGLSAVQQNQALTAAFGGSKSGGTLVQLLGQLGDLKTKYKEIGKNAGDFNEKLKETNADPEVKMKKAWSAIQATLIQLGDVILPIVVPMVQKLADHIAEAGEKFSKLSPNSKRLVVEVGAAIAALGPLLSFGGKLFRAYDKVAGTIRKIAGGIGGISAAESIRGGGNAAAVVPAPSVKKRLAAGEQLSPVIGAEGAAATIAAPAVLDIPAAPGVAAAGADTAGLLAAVPPAAPWIALGAAVAAASVGVLELYRHSKTFRDIVAPLGKAVTDSFHEIRAQVAPLAHSITDLVAEVGRELRSEKGIIGAAKGFYRAFKTPIDDIGVLLKSGLVHGVAEAFSVIADTVRGFGQSFAGSMQVLQGAIETITGLMTFKFGKAWQGVKDIFTGGARVVLGTVRAIFAPLTSSVKSIGGMLQGVFGGTWERVESIFLSGVNAVIGLLNDMIGLVDKLQFIHIAPIGEVGARSTSKGGLGKSRSGASFHRAAGGIVPGQGEGDTFPTYVPPGTFILNKKATRAFGFAEGGAVPVMLEPGEKVFHPDEVRQYGIRTLEAANAAVPRFSIGGVASSIGNDITSLPGKALGAAQGLGGSAVDAILSSLPNPAASLPKWLAGFGDYLKSQLVAWVKGKQKKFGKLHGSVGGLQGPNGIGTYMGIPMADWVIGALEFAASKGIAPPPTSGYRPPGEVVTGPVVAPQGHSEHQGTQYPHGAVDFGGPIDPAAKVKKMAVVHATSRFKYPLLAPIGFRDDGHASGTGHQVGGLVQRIQRLARGGWTKVGATIDPEYGNPAYSNHGGMSFAELLQAGANRSLRADSLTATLGIGPPHYVAGGQDYGMAMGTPIEVKMPGKSKSFTMYKNDVGSGQGGDPHYKVDLHSHIASALGWSGNADIEVAAAGAGGKESDAHSFKENVPTLYHGVRTDNLSFGSIPKSLRGIEKELKKWRAELPRYRQAAKRAAKESKPAIEHAIRGNITAIEGQVRKLELARAKERRVVAQRKFTKRLSKSLGKITGFEKLIEAAQRTYEIKDQFAGQVVGLEPVQPELPGTATDGEREASEKAFVGRLTDYIHSQETPAYSAVLGSENVLRNTILQGEHKAAGDWSGGKVGGLEGGWEDRISKLHAHIESISAMPASHPDKWWHSHPAALKKLHELMAKLPMLRYKETGLRKSLGEARESFYPGGASILEPKPPLAGTGSFEDALTNVQGIHWPDQHEVLKSLPEYRSPGVLGGAIWDTEEAIEGLGLKITQAANSLGTPGGGENSERVALLEQIVREGKQREILGEIEKRVFAGMPKPGGLQLGGLAYGGKFHQGGVIPGPPTQEVLSLTRGGEAVFTEDQRDWLGAAITGGPAAMGGPPVIEEMHIYPDGQVKMRYEGQEFETAVRKVTSHDERRKARGAGRRLATPGVFG